MGGEGNRECRAEEDGADEGMGDSFAVARLPTLRAWCAARDFLNAKQCWFVRRKSSRSVLRQDLGSTLS